MRQFVSPNLGISLPKDYTSDLKPIHSIRYDLCSVKLNQKNYIQPKITCRIR